MDDYLQGLIDSLSSADGMARMRARETLVLVGDPAVPRLRALLAGPDKRVRWRPSRRWRPSSTRAASRSSLACSTTPTRTYAGWQPPALSSLGPAL